MKDKNKNERGDVVVEATIMLPIAILCVIFLLYTSIFIFQKAILQSALETSVVYFKNTLTDNYVSQNETVTYTAGEGSVAAQGNSYQVTGPLNPYNKFTITDKKLSWQEFEKYFYSIANNLLYKDDINLKIDYSNYILFKEIRVTAEQDIKFPIDLSIIGIDGDVHLSAAARVAVVDHDELIRNADYAIDILEDTKVGEAAGKIASKIGEVYDKMHSKLFN
ncbi:MAG: hypothetical protein J6C19_00055 [Lachnospiraceae bacterium]|nr:hypothetical protein [Lachnospiraceae bacterium]